MKLEEELQYMSDFYPKIFPTRKHALNHLFCVIGNGYKWVDGELVSKNEYKERYKLIQKIEKAKFREEEHWMDMSEMLKELDTNLKIKSVYTFEWYPLAVGYSCLFSYPQDIKEDWLRGIEETKELLKQDGIEF